MMGRVTVMVLTLNLPSGPYCKGLVTSPRCYQEVMGLSGNGTSWEEVGSLGSCLFLSVAYKPPRGDHLPQPPWGDHLPQPCMPTTAVCAVTRPKATGPWSLSCNHELNSAFPPLQEFSQAFCHTHWKPTLKETRTKDSSRATNLRHRCIRWFGTGKRKGEAKKSSLRQ